MLDGDEQHVLRLTPGLLGCSVAGDTNTCLPSPPYPRSLFTQRMRAGARRKGGGGGSEVRVEDEEGQKWTGV